MDDQRGGKLWAIEKHTKIILCYEGIECRIDGTYRHIHFQRGFEIEIGRASCRERVSSPV